MLLSLVYINCDYLQAQTTIPRFEEGERVVFVGNSITHGGHYHSFIWLYYMTRFPDKPITIMNAGIGGESAWDMKDRLDYDVFNRKPTYVTLTFGMNDTGYDIYMKDDAKELSEQRIAKSLESYREIEERLLAKNKIKKVLLAYKLFYVGCSRAKQELTVFVSENEIREYKEEFVDKFKKIGFEVC